MKSNIGFMQGRLSPIIDGKIQAFPKSHWRKEFAAAQSIGLHLLEWTLDHDGLELNPLMTEAGRAEIRNLLARHDMEIPSITGDCFMQAPFFKVSGAEAKKLQGELRNVIAAAAEIGARIIVMPLVDNGAIENADQHGRLLDGLGEITEKLKKFDMTIAFESDYGPQELAGFIGELPEGAFTINYDTGNSAALGFDPIEEFAAYGRRVANVHIKDRVLGGTTVPLGQGDTDFANIFSCLTALNYDGNLILQTARTQSDEHAEVLDSYRSMVVDWCEGAQRTDAT
jgi:L-ribulose-5-phosphate 3-epimerase